MAKEYKHILVLVGLSMTGKSTIRDEIIQMSNSLKEEDRISKLLPSTSRPRREDEMNKLEYIFTVPDVFSNEKNFISHAQYTTSTGDIFHYGLSYGSLYTTIHLNVLISNPTEIEQLMKNLPKEYTLHIAFFNLSDDELQKRLDNVKNNGVDRGRDDIVDRINRDKQYYNDFLDKYSEKIMGVYFVEDSNKEALALQIYEDFLLSVKEDESSRITDALTDILILEQKETLPVSTLTEEQCYALELMLKANGYYVRKITEDMINDFQECEKQGNWCDECTASCCAMGKH